MSDQGPSRLGQLVDHGPLYPGLSHPGQLVEPAGPRTLFESCGRAGRNCRPSDMGPSDPGQLVNTAGLRTQ